MNAKTKAERCPCCSCRTLNERGAFEMCPVCWWEDDGQDNADADVARGGPNGELSLSDARANYYFYGASDRQYVDQVREPTPYERPVQPFPDASTLNWFVGRLAQQLRAEHAVAAAERLDSVRTSTWTTSSEWLGELGQATRAVEKGETLSPAARRALRRILEAVHVVRPDP